MKKSLAATLLIFVSVMKMQAQNCPKFWSRDNAKSYLYSGLTVVGQPFRYDWKSWAVVGGVSAFAAVSFIYDDKIYDYFHGRVSENQAKSVNVLTGVFGEEYFQVPAAAALYAISAISKDCRMRTASLSVLQAFVYAEAATVGIKVLSCRLRPEDAENQWKWEGPFSTFSSTSFVSGHAMRSFAFAAAIAGAYKDCTWIGVGAYTLAAVSSAGRVIGNEHWCSDVVVGAAIGYFIGRGVSKYWQNVDVTGSVYGIGLSYKF